MEIKIAIENDSKEISKLMLELGYNSSIKLLCEKIQEFEQSTTDQVFVAIKDNEIVGCVSCHLTLLFHKPGSAGRITSLVVPFFFLFITTAIRGRRTAGRNA